MIMPLRRVCGAWLTAERAVRVRGLLAPVVSREQIDERLEVVGVHRSAEASHHRGHPSTLGLWVSSSARQ